MVALLDELVSSASFTHWSIHLLRSEVPAYRSVSDESITACVEWIRRSAAPVLIRGGGPLSRELVEAENATLEKLQEGVDFQDAMVGFRSVITGIQGWIVDRAPVYGVSVGTVLELSQQLWGWSTAFCNRAGETHRRYVTSGQSEPSEQRRTRWVTGLLASNLSQQDIGLGCAEFRICHDALAHAICVAAVPQDALQGIATRLIEDCTASSGAGESVTMLVPGAGGLIGFTTSPPESSRIPVAVGPARPLSSLNCSYVIAQDLLAAVGSTAGVHSLESVSWRVAVPAQDALNAFLDRRYLVPLREHGAFGELIIEALQAWLNHDRKAARAAASIPVHRNTLRYRLSRFEELTECSLDETETIIELTWALAASSALRSE
ncbi:PucR family transcriptional regulator [Tsukamurella tyrosinosolvens]|uniref:PucR family transcriptional regulator n=1 Tax=Tsukamurella tyrosinosolvens TaxID=57704 RepID=UPI00079A18E4|nr:helix-turn-helix domain-containing protein [Tsukamurella tyrosinosolvens]KXP08413.1 hypothetical protein AXK59_23725 [Tsukamurella tyrosinosolvens]